MRDGFEVEGKFRGRRENILFVQTVQWGGILEMGWDGSFRTEDKQEGWIQIVLPLPLVLDYEISKAMGWVQVAPPPPALFGL